MVDCVNKASAYTKKLNKLKKENNSLKIRHVKETELAELLSLLKAKAEFDGCPESLLATEETLKDALFSENPVSNALVAEVDGKLVGIATYYNIYSSFIAKPGLWLDDLYIYEEYRNQNIGFELMKNLSLIAEKKGCARVDWLVSKSNKNGKDFYRKIGAKILEEVQFVRLDDKALNTLTTLK